MGMMINRRRVCGGGKSLPYDYEVEYLESTGTQYIDTGITPDANTKIVFKFTNLQATGDAIIGYVYSDDINDWRFFNFNSRAYFDTFGNKRIYNASNIIVVGTTYILEMGNYYIKNLQTGTDIARGTAYTGSGIERIYINGNCTQSKNRWYYIQIYDNDTLIRDYIPVRIGQVGYLYDKVTKQLFGNQGTGDFVLGPDK